MDPLFEMQPGYTPYHYCFNDPVNGSDPSGLVVRSKTVVIEGDLGYGDECDGSTGFFGSWIDQQLKNNDLVRGVLYARAYMVPGRRGGLVDISPFSDGGGSKPYVDPGPRMTPEKPIRQGEYRTEDEAAVAFLKQYNAYSIVQNTEIGANIYKNQRGYFSYTKAQYGSSTKIWRDYTVPDGCTLVALAHTHSAYMFIKGLIESGHGFSGGDLYNARATQVNSYIANPWGEVYKFTYSSKSNNIKKLDVRVPADCQATEVNGKLHRLVNTTLWQQTYYILDESGDRHQIDRERFIEYLKGETINLGEK